jgi:serine/threonine protein kinase
MARNAGSDEQDGGSRSGGDSAVLADDPDRGRSVDIKTLPRFAGNRQLRPGSTRLCYIRGVRGAKERSAQAQARVGSILAGKWTIERLIGLGGMAAVFEARHHNQRRVAVKLLEPGTGVERTRLQREGYAANRVGHPGVV